MIAYSLLDPYFRFYFRFLAPHQDDLVYRPDQVLPRIRQGFRAFVEITAFEELSREWVAETLSHSSRAQGLVDTLPFDFQDVGSHWSRRVQVDVVAVNWNDRAILLGEAKWGAAPVGRGVIRELVDIKTPKVLKDLPGEGQGWQVHYAFFARSGFTNAARAQAEPVEALLVDLDRLDADLASANL